ncbi:MAG: hypothetical protein ABI036_01240 [Fibrobacteria bacterium]
MVQRMLSRMLAMAALCLPAASMWGCQTTESDPPPASHQYPITFDLTSVVEGLSVDSIVVEMAIAGGQPQVLKVDLKTGEAVSQVAAKPGDAFQLRFTLYAGGVRIGKGVLTGVLAPDDHQVLEPVFDSLAIAQVKQRLADGQRLPADLSERYGLAIASVPMIMRLDSASGVRFVWTVSPEGNPAATGEGREFSWTPTAGQAGKSASVRVEAWEGDVLAQARDWLIHVIGTAPQGRLLRYTTRSDTSARIGTLTRLSYSPGLTLRQTYGDLDPARDALPVALDSLQTDNLGRPLLIRTSLSSGEAFDSAFSWSPDGHMSSLRVRQGASVLVDSFTWIGGELRQTRHFLNDSLVERLVHSRAGDSGSDTLFVPGGDSKWEMARLFRLRYQGENLVEKSWYLLRNGWTVYRRETFAFTGLGMPLRRQTYSEGEISEAETSERWFYDGAGALVRRLGRDDRTGLSEFSLDFVWETPLAKRTAGIIPAHPPINDDAGEALAVFKRVREETRK